MINKSRYVTGSMYFFGAYRDLFLSVRPRLLSALLKVIVSCVSCLLSFIQLIAIFFPLGCLYLNAFYITIVRLRSFLDEVFADISFLLTLVILVFLLLIIFLSKFALYKVNQIPIRER